MTAQTFNIFKITVISLILTFIAGCGSGSSNSAADGTGSITTNLVWSTSGKATAKTVGLAPVGVVTVRFSVSGPGIDQPITKNFPANAGSGTMDGIKAGSGRTLTVQGLSSDNSTVLYQGASPNNPLTIQIGQTTEAGTIVMLPLNPPTTPTGLTATAVSAIQINLSWTDTASNETGFKLERRTGITGTWAQIATAAANATSFSDSGLTADTTYYYRLRATNSAGDSGYSNEVSVKTGSVTGAARLNGKFGGAFFREANPSQSVSGYYSKIFDGLGNLSFSGIYSMTGFQANASESGNLTYSINADGSFLTSNSNNPLFLNQTNDMFVSAEVMSPSTEGQTIGVFAKRGTGSYTNASLSGSYYFAQMNYSYSAFVGHGLIDTMFGTFTFNGSGTYTVTGKLASLASSQNVPISYSGTYSVLPDGSVTIIKPGDPGEAHKGYLNASGDVVLLANTDDVNLQSIVYMVKGGGSTFSNASLNGDYSIVKINNFSNLVESCYGTMSFNGAGSQSFAGKCGRSNGTADSSVSVGPKGYSVNTNGTFNAVDDAANDFSFDGALSPGSRYFIGARINGLSQLSIFFGIKK